MGVRWGSRESPHLGGFAHVNDKMYICVLYIIIHSCFAAFFSFFPFFLLIIPIMCKYCNLSHNLCNLTLYLLVKIVSCFDLLIKYKNIKKKNQKYYDICEITDGGYFDGRFLRTPH